MRRLLLVATCVVGTAVMAAAAIGAANSDAVPASEHERSDTFWNLSHLTADEAEYCGSLSALANSADAVVIGNIVATGPSRAVVKDGEEIAWYGKATIDITKTLSGDPLGALDFELFFFHRGNYDRFLTASIPTEQAVFFLRNKETAARIAGWTEEQAQSEAGNWMLVNESESLFRLLDGVVHGPGTQDDSFVTTWEGKPFDSFVSAVTLALAK